MPPIPGDIENSPICWEITTALLMPFVCEAVLVLLIIWSCLFDEKVVIRHFKALQNLRIKAPTKEFADWRMEQEARLPGIFVTHPLCTICLDIIEDHSQIRGLPCLHVFHRQCLDRWFAGYHDTCPLCRSSILDLYQPVTGPLPA